MTNVPLSWKSEVKKGAYQRTPSVFRNFVSKQSTFQPEPNRFHLYISHACPWANRTMISRALKGLEKVISYSVVHHHLDNKGWRFLKNNESDEMSPGTTIDHLHGFERLREVYELSDESFHGKVTVPVLFDKKLNKIVNNESSEIIRMFNTEFNEWAENPELDLYPENLRDEIDSINEWVYHDINNGVYKCLFAQTQEAYEQSFDRLFNALDRVEEILSSQRYLVGDKFTEADVRLFTTLVRFDPVYVTHAKCNRNRLKEFENIWNYMLEIYQMPGISDTINFFHIKHHYYESHTSVNPYGIVAKGFDIDMNEKHNRDDKFPKQ